ncbi:hypothetical protein F4776DRAFT_317843 [Hypoxylon sp. NC0597]|nr:hypothetical protein F4776DRAFT_317843 [Hypoxylon sp. NC0597]
MESQRTSILEDRQTSAENLGEIRLLCEGIFERMVNANNLAEWQKRAHEADMKIQTQGHQIQGLQDDLNQMCIRTNEQCKEREELRKELTGLRNAAVNEQAANQKVHGLTEKVQRFQGILNEKDTTITKANQNLEAVQEKLILQARIVQEREEQIQNEREQHKKALELSIQQRQQAITCAVDKETQELKANHQATEQRLQEADIARAQLERELAKARQEIEISSERNVEDIRQIQGEILAVTASVTESTTMLEEFEDVREDLRGSLENWSRQRADIDQIQYMLGRLARDQPNAIQMSNQLKELLEIQKKLAGTLEYHQPELISSRAVVVSGREQQNGETNTQLEHNSTLISSQLNVAAHLQEKSKNLKRKVMVKSPVNEDDHALPLSVEEERSTRRQSAPPRGIMKVGPHSAARGLEIDGKASNMDAQISVAPQAQSKRKIARRGSKAPFTTHSMYNRPVAGSVLESSVEPIDSNQPGSNGHGSGGIIDRITSSSGNSDITLNSSHETIETDDVDEPLTKRQRTFEADQHQIQGWQGAQRTKLSRSMSAQSSTQKPKDVESLETMPSEPNTLLTRGGAIERRSSGLVTYSSHSSVMKRSASQSFIISNAEKSVESQSTVGSSQ